MLSMLFLIIFLTMMTVLLYFMVFRKYQHDELIIKGITLTEIEHEKQNKSDILLLKRENEFEIANQKQILCVGTRGSELFIRSIKDDNKFIHPNTFYGHQHKWELSNDKKYIIINNIKIPIEKARNTSFQCWGIVNNSITVDIKEFNEHLLKLSKSQ